MATGTQVKKSLAKAMDGGTPNEHCLVKKHKQQRRDFDYGEIK